jgi:hypothetical protein
MRIFGHFFASLVLFLRSFSLFWAIWPCFLAKTHWDSEKYPLGLLIFASTNSDLGGSHGLVAVLVTFDIRGRKLRQFNNMDLLLWH